MPPSPDDGVVSFDDVVAFEVIFVSLNSPGVGVVISSVEFPGGGVVVPPPAESPVAGDGVVPFCPTTSGAASANAKIKTTPRNSRRSLIAVPNEGAALASCLPLAFFAPVGSALVCKSKKKRQMKQAEGANRVVRSGPPLAVLVKGG